MEYARYKKDCATETLHTVDLPNFEHVPYFEHHVIKGFSKPTTYKLFNLVHIDVFRLVNEIKRLQSEKFFVYMVFKIRYMFKIRQIHSISIYFYLVELQEAGK